MSPTLWMLKPEVCTEIANLRMAPTTTRTIPKDVRPMPEDLFIAATSNRDLSLQTFTRLTSIQPARSASCLHRPRCNCARPPAAAGQAASSPAASSGAGRPREDARLAPAMAGGCPPGECLPLQQRTRHSSTSVARSRSSLGVRDADIREARRAEPVRQPMSLDGPPPALIRHRRRSRSGAPHKHRRRGTPPTPAGQLSDCQRVLSAGV
jgi:hypothetical protein